jgi:hypothetical protein
MATLASPHPGAPLGAPWAMANDAISHFGINDATSYTASTPAARRVGIR